MAAKVLRLFRNLELLPDGEGNPAFDPERPLFWTECLADDSGATPVWSDDLTRFVRFPTYHEADERAKVLRETDPSHPFAKSIEREGAADYLSGGVEGCRHAQQRTDADESSPAERDWARRIYG